jgi:hypothetical protein
MPDITMCKGYDCPMCELCYRYKAIPALEWQSWFANDPREQDGTCNYFWRTNESNI